MKKTYIWNTEKVATNHRLDYQITRAVDFWVNTTLEGYIIEFIAENYQYFSWAKEIFKKGSRGRPLREIHLWIKAFFMEGGMIPIPLTEMAA
jgi:hypothetical protein